MDDRTQGNWTAVESQLAGLECRYVENPLDEANQPVGFGLDNRQRFPRRWRTGNGRFGHDDLKSASDARQGRTQFVGDQRHEFRLQAIKLAQFTIGRFEFRRP